MGHGRERAGHGVPETPATSRGPAWPSRATRRTAEGVHGGSDQRAGWDVVAGVRTPGHSSRNTCRSATARAHPADAREALQGRAGLRVHHRRRRRLHAQTRNGKRTAMAALKFSMDMFKEKLIDWKTAVMRNPADQLDQLLAPVFDVAEARKAAVIATGLPAGPGAASGQIYFNADRAVAAAERKEQVLLVRVETSPEDLRGMIAAEGILTARGGVSSHAALVARQMGKVWRGGAPWTPYRNVKVEGRTFKEGDWMTVRPGRPGVSRPRHPDRGGAGRRRRGGLEDRAPQELPAADEVVRPDACGAPTPTRLQTSPSRRRRHRPLPTEHMFCDLTPGKRRSPSCCRISATTSPVSSGAQGIPGDDPTRSHEFLPQTPEQQAPAAPRRRFTCASIAPRVQPDARPRGAAGGSTFPRSPRCRRERLRGGGHRSEGGNQGSAGSHDSPCRLQEQPGSAARDRPRVAQAERKAARYWSAP